MAKGPRDGSLLLLTTPSTVTAAATVQRVPFDMNNDLVPVSMLQDGPMVVVVSGTSAIRTPADIVAAARARPDTLTYGTSGAGTLVHLSFEIINDAAKIQLKHIPYKGAAFAVGDIVSDTVNMTLGNYSSYASLVAAGRLRAVAVTSREPSSAFPGLPTMASVAPGVDLGSWRAIFVAAGTPAPLAARLNRELNDIAATKEVRELMAIDGGIPTPLTLEQLRLHMRKDFATWKKIAADKKIVID